MKISRRNIIIFLIALGVIIFLVNSYGKNEFRNAKLQNYSTFLNNLNSGKIKDVTMGKEEIFGHIKNTKAEFKTYYPRIDSALLPALKSQKVIITIKSSSSGTGILISMLISWLPMILLIGIWIFFMRQMQSGGSKMMGFNQSKAKLIREKTGVTFDDVAGIEEVKSELFEIVDFLRNSLKYTKLGGKLPKGVLLVGSPGTGKTLMAKAVAGEAKVPFFFISGSDFVEMFVGVGASRVRSMFNTAKKHAPCIIFIDELDAVGRHRGAGMGGGNDEREQTLNQILVELDGFQNNKGVIILAATNRPDVLDPALLRPGRFDRQIVVPLPDVAGREQILKVHTKGKPMAPYIDLKTIARGTPGFSGADLANLLNEAALYAASNNKKIITLPDLEYAKDKIMMGVERKSLIMSEEEKKLTAYHEAGHAIASIHLKASDPIHKATIIPRGRALGMVMRLPEKDALSMPYDKIIANLVVAMGGRVAEILTFGKNKITTGASSDIQMATKIARLMVTEWGLSKKLGPIRYSSNQEEIFVGHAFSKETNISNNTMEVIDSEIKRIIDEAYVQCLNILTKHKDQMELLALALLKYETLTGAEINDIVAGKDIKISSSQDSGKINSIRKSSLI